MNSRNMYALSLAVVIILVMQSVPGVVLCLDKDGKASVENYFKGLCCEPVAKLHNHNKTTVHPIAENCSGKGECDSCLDIRASAIVAQDDVLSQNKMDLEIVKHTFAAYILPVSLYHETPDRTSFVKELPKINSSLATLQTTILTC